MTSINKHLKHTVDIVYVTMTKGVRTTTQTSDVPAFITQKTVVIRDELGDHYGVRDVVFLKGDVVLNEIDELIIDNKQRPIVNISRVHTKSSVIHHLEVVVQ